MNRFVKHALIFAMVATFGLAVNAVQAQTTYSIYGDDFSRTGVLNGSTTTVGNGSWIANVNITTDGVQASTFAQYQNAYLPFVPKTGFVYTLTANLNTTETPGDSWGAFGFSQNTDTTAKNWFPGSVGWGWWLQRGNRATQGSADNTFLGPFADNGSPPLTVAPSGYSTYQVVLDTTGNQPLFTFARDGVVLDSRYLSRQATINYLGFGANGTSMSVANLSLNVSGAAINNPEYTWTGNVAGDSNFGSAGLNWVNSSNAPAAPGDNSVVHLVFGAAGTNGTALNNDYTNLTVADPTSYGGGTAAPGIHFTAAAPAYTIAGHDITFLGDIVNDSPNTQTFNAGLLSPGSFAINGNSPVVLNGGVMIGGLQIASTPGSQGHVILNYNNNYSSTLGELQIGPVGTGTLTLNSTATDPVTFSNAAALRVGGKGYEGTAGGTLVLTTSSTFNQSTDDLTVGWGKGTTGLLQMNAGSTFNFTTGNWVYVGIGGTGELSMADGTVFNAQGDMRFGQGGGSGRLTMTGGTLSDTGGYIYIGTDGAGTSYANLSNNATINKTGGDIRIGNGGSTGIMTMTDTAQINHNVPNWFIVGATGGNGTLTMTGHSTITKTMSDLVIGVDAGSVGKVVLKENASLLYSGGDSINIGRNGATGTLEVHDNATFTTSTGLFCVGRDGGTGTLILDGVNPIAVNSLVTIIGENGGNAANGANGTMKMSGTVAVTMQYTLPTTDSNAGKFVIGNHPGAIGYFEMTDGTSLEHITNEIQIGVSGTGVLKMYGGTAAAHPVLINHGSMRVGHNENAPGTGTLDISGYSQFIELGNDMRAVSVATFGSTGTLSVADHASYVQADGNFWLTWGGGGNGTLNLKGGLFESRNIISDGGTATVNWQGGTFKIAPTGDANPFFSWNGGTETFNIGLGANGFGAIIDTNGINLTIDPNLQHDALVTGLDGGLTKVGPGSLTLNGTLTYNGNTTVNEGTLTVKNIDTPNAKVYVATGTTLNAVSILADTLTIGGAPIVIPTAASTVPEPGSLVLLALAGLAFVGAYLRRK